MDKIIQAMFLSLFKKEKKKKKKLKKKKKFTG